MTEHSLFAKRVGLTAVSTLIVSLAPIILLAVLTKTTAATGYGVWIQVTVTTDVLPFLTTLGLTVAMMRLLAGTQERNAIREGFYASLVIALLSSALVAFVFYLLAEPLAGLLFDGNTTVTTILPAIIFITSFNYMCLGYFRARQQIKRFAFFTALQACFTVLVVSTFVLFGYGISGAVLGLLLAQLLLSFLLTVRIISELGVVLPTFANARSYLSLGLPTVPGNLSYWIVNSSDRYIISIFLGAIAVGYYSPGYTTDQKICFFYCATALFHRCCRFNFCAGRVRHLRRGARTSTGTTSGVFVVSIPNHLGTRPCVPHVRSRTLLFVSRIANYPK
jgi:O-antigen/teichoic acid export membrane protein